jgi:hypothetical protein
MGGRLADGARAAARAHPFGLTQREQEVLALLSEGLPDREISGGWSSPSGPCTTSQQCCPRPAPPPGQRSLPKPHGWASVPPPRHLPARNLAIPYRT